MASLVVFVTIAIVGFALPVSGIYNTIDIIDHCGGYVTTEDLGRSTAAIFYSQKGARYTGPLCRIRFSTDSGDILFVNAEHLDLGDSACLKLHDSRSTSSYAEVSAKYCTDKLFQFNTTQQYLTIELTTRTTTDVGFRLVVTPVVKEVRCPKAFFSRCASGGCISDDLLADGHRNCPDNSDEKDFPTLSCSNGLITCNGSKACIPKSFKCDGFVDCPNQVDEKDCIYKCPGDSTTGSSYHKLQCRDGNDCFYPSDRCDTYHTCSDHSDDMNCDSCSSFYEGYHGYCPITRTCLSSDQICDGIEDCPNGSDEQYDMCNPSIYLYWTSGQLAGLFIGFIIFVIIVIAIVVVVHKKCRKQET